MAKKKKSPAPSGLSITRSRSTITFSWAGSYDDHVNLQYHINYSWSGVINLGANATTYSIGISEGSYFPYTGSYLSSVGFQVQGDKKKTKKTNWTMSSWAGATFYPTYPAAPKVTFEKAAQYVTTYTMELPNHINDREWWGNNIQYRTALRINANDASVNDIPESAWEPITREVIYNSITQSDNTTFTYTATDTDNSAAIENAESAVRWFEARACGPRGPSSWVAISTSYSEPYPAEITKGIAKPNVRKGIDCTVNFDYLCSISRPISTMKLQYAFSTPGGVYVEYAKTKDVVINTDKTYYTLTTTKVASPTNDGVADYYEINEDYSTTTDRKSAGAVGVTGGAVGVTGNGIDPNKTYYQATVVESPDIADRDSYWECSEEIIYERIQKTVVETVGHKYYHDASGKLVPRTKEITSWEEVPDKIVYNFSRTLDTAIDSEKVYYTIAQVSDPSEDGLPADDMSATPESYIEQTRNSIDKTTDTVIVKGKRYYTVEGTIVLYPVLSNINTYYDIININYIQPTAPSWQDAEIGGDNTIVPGKSPGALARYSAAVSFSIDSEMPEDQLLYIRVNTSYNNQTTSSSYYLCTDDEGKIPSKDSLLSAPTIDEVYLGYTNHLHLEVTNTSDAKGVKIATILIPPEGNDNTELIDVAIPNQNGVVNKTIEIPPKYVTTGFGIGVYAFIGQHILAGRIGATGATGETGAIGQTGSDEGLGYDLYIVKPIIKSKLITYGGEIPVPPTNVAADHIGNGNVLVTWDWNWKDADYAEIAWSDYSEAPDSNEPPTTYQVPNSKNNRLIVRNLETGKTWYFWARLGKEENVSIWSNTIFENLSSSPSIPSLSLTRRYITLDEKFTANWTYVSTDGTPQQSAKICSCTVNGNQTYYDNIIAEIPENEGSSSETQYIVLDPSSEKLSWEEGHDYYLAVQVTSASGMISEKWSDTVPITVVKSIESSLESSSLYPAAIDYDPEATYSVGDYAIKIIDDPDDMTKQKGILYKCIVAITEPEEWNEDHWAVDVNQPYQELRSLPLTASVNVSDDSAETYIIIERSQDYFLDRPDGSESNGHKGEAVVQASEILDGSFSISQEDLDGYLDDGAFYYMTTRVSDNYGQTKEVRYEFKVNWTHQALMPVADTTIDNQYSVVKINIGTPEIPSGDSITGDCCDIYRKSADGYVLLYEGAAFNKTYVDPYPTIGDHGGYRVVYRTRNGDYIAANNAFAWEDLDDDEDMINSPAHIIDFEGGTVNLMYNVDIDNNWRKDFQETHYLGGSIQGDWNMGVSKTTSMSVNVLSNDWDTMSAMRLLASHNGECHIRTRDGSNFLANVEVSEKMPYAVYTDPNGDDTHIVEYSLSITKLDPIEPDGLTLEEWLASISD